jgi:hypothetical protein
VDDYCQLLSNAESRENLSQYIFGKRLARYLAQRLKRAMQFQKYDLFKLSLND